MVDRPQHVVDGRPERRFARHGLEADVQDGDVVYMANFDLLYKGTIQGAEGKSAEALVSVCGGDFEAQEIVRICEAAHVPDVWATQVLENLAKKGTPSRAEITDAAVSQRAECVMLNKGVYIEKAVIMLDKILRRMQFFQERQDVILPALDGADDLRLSHEKYDIGN